MHSRTVWNCGTPGKLAMKPGEFMKYLCAEFEAGFQPLGPSIAITY